MLEDADASGSIDPPRDRASGSRRSVFTLIRVDDLLIGRIDELEATDRRDVADRLMLALGVVGRDPGVELGLSVLDRGERASFDEEFLSHRLVQPLDLAGGRG